MFVNYAHRGASAYAPDSTISAFDMGIEMQANGIETDLQRTKDGHIVLFHNLRLDGRCSGTGELKDYTLAELKEMDFGEWKDEKYKGERILTLREFAERYFHLDLTFALELKAEGCEEETLKIINEFGVRDKVYVTSFYYEYLKRVRELDKDIRISWLVLEPKDEYIEMLKAIGGSQLCPLACNATEADVERINASGLRVRMWGIGDDMVLMRRLARMDIDGMTINYPDRLEAYLEARKETEYIREFEARLKALKVVRGYVSSGINSTVITEKVARSSMDFAVFDGEHGVFNAENLVPHLQIFRLLKKPSFVRVADCSYQAISRMLYMGADGIMVPRVETVEQVKTAVESMNFAPVGRLGCGGHAQYRADEDATYFKRMLALQIESPVGIANLPEMLERYGEYISVIVIGPYDLTVTSGIPMQFDDPLLEKEVREIFDISAAHGVPAGIFCDNAESAHKYIEMGASFIWLGLDTNIFMDGFNRLYDAVGK